jgi:monoterpene epsilon-lactone hydrolase
MLSYRYLWTKLLCLYAGYSLRALMRDMTSVASYDEQKKIAIASRKKRDLIKSRLQLNKAIKKITRRKIGSCWLYDYEPKQRRGNELLVFFHGGGYIFGSHCTHGAVASDIAVQLQTKVCLVEYPMVPESKLKQTVSTAIDVMQKLLDIEKPMQYSIFGHSSGGGVALQCVIEMVRQNKVLPRCMYLVSPSVQHCFSGDKQAILAKCKTDEVLGKTYRFLMENEQAKESAIAILGGREVAEVLRTDRQVLKSFPCIHMTYQNDEVLSIGIKQVIQLFTSLGVEVVDNSVDNSFHAFLVYNYLPQTRYYIQQLQCEFEKHRV